MSNPLCLITGASSGIGAATARAFAAAGYDVAINYNTGGDRAQAIAAELEQSGVSALPIQANLSNEETAFDLVDEAYAHFGRLDVVVSNSGVANYVRDEQGNLLRYRFHEAPVEHLQREMDRVMNLNLLGAYRLVQRSLHYMIQQADEERARNDAPSHRSVVVIASISDEAPESTRIPYGASKAALNHVVLGAALEGGPHNITVNGLRPGVIDTPLTSRPSGMRDPDRHQELTVAEIYQLMAEGGSQAIPRIGTSEEIADAAVAFARLPFMTGQLIAVDGGFTLRSGFANRDLFLNEGLRKRRQ